MSVMMIEEWRAAPGTDGRYMVSSLGRIKNTKTGRLLKATVTTGGYRRVSVDQRSGSLRQPHLHRLVCEAFSGPPPFEGAEARHLDGDSLNNLATNLAWGTTRDNAADRLEHGTQVRGSLHGKAKLSEADVRDIRAEFRPRHASMGGSRWRSNAPELAERYGVTPVAIRYVVKEGWAHV